MTTPINNSFKDNATGLAFLVPASRQLSTAEAEACASQWIQQKKVELLAAWKARNENKDWQGDVSTKKEDLFREFLEHRQSSSESLLMPVPSDTE